MLVRVLRLSVDCRRPIEDKIIIHKQFLDQIKNIRAKLSNMKGLPPEKAPDVLARKYSEGFWWEPDAGPGIVSEINLILTG